MTSIRNRLEQRAKKRLKEFHRAAGQVERLIDPLNRLVIGLVVEGRPHPKVVELADSLTQQMKPLIASLDQLHGQWATGASPKAASEQCAKRLLQNLNQPAQQQARAEAARPANKKSGSNCLLRGSSRCVPIATILEFLSTQGKTGTLRINTGHETFTFEMLEGDIVHTATDRPPRDQLLGNILVDRGAITAEKLDTFLEQCSDSATKIGEALEGGELVSRDDLRDALEFQVQQRFDRMFSADEATFYFYETTADSNDERIRMNVTHLLLESARKSDESDVPPPEEETPAPPPSQDHGSWNTPHTL